MMRTKVSVFTTALFLVAIGVSLGIGLTRGETQPDTTPLIISRLSSSDVTETSATITWSTNVPATSVVSWNRDYSDNGIIFSVGIIVAYTQDLRLVKNHSITLDRLAPGTGYCYGVTSTDSYGNEAGSGAYTFTTLGTAIGPTQTPDGSTSKLLAK